MSATFRAAVIGCGRKGLTIDDERKCPINYTEGPASHAAAFAALSDTELVAVVDPDPSARRRALARHPGVRAYASHEELFSEEKIDVVGVATRAPERAAAAVAAARAGVRVVVCEKALATSVAEATAIVESCRGAGAVLVVDYPRRYHPTYTAARVAIEQGTIGALRLMFATASARLVHNGTHFFDLFRFFAGEAVSVSGRADGEEGQDGDGHACVTFANGVVAFLDAQARTEARLVLVGEEGQIEIDGSFPGYTVTIYEARAQRNGHPWYAGQPCKGRAVAHVTVHAQEATLPSVIRDGLHCLSNGSSPRSSGEDGLRALEIALGVFHSERDHGRTVALPLADPGLRIESR